ncbi:hypothetical protein AA313_de0202350 [Arthrobotrys entomopaga]|nr:hypothetical protein AA313_de0202350 [Arthrobotrys entomopaga]
MDGQERPASPIPEYILKALATGKTKPGTPRIRRFALFDSNRASRSPTPGSIPSPSRTSVRSGTPNVQAQVDNEDSIIDPALSYRPRYHHNLNSPSRNLAEYFFATTDVEIDKDRNGKQNDEEENIAEGTNEEEKDGEQEGEQGQANDTVDGSTQSQQIKLFFINRHLPHRQQQDFEEQQQQEDLEEEEQQEGVQSQAQAKVSRLNLTFKRNVRLKRALSVLKVKGRDKYNEERRRLSLEVKFPEVAELAKGVWKRMRESLILHEDLATGHVAFSRWNINGTCPDPEIFDMLMAYAAIRKECEMMKMHRRTEIRLWAYSRFIRATDIVKRYTVTEKRIKCHAFNKLVFKLPIKLPASTTHPTTALSFFGNVAIRYDESTGHFMFSGLYHKVELEGMSTDELAMVDYHTAQKKKKKTAMHVRGGTGVTPSVGVMRLKEW